MARVARDFGPWPLDNRLVAALRLDHDHTIVDATSRFLELFGLAAGSLTGQSLVDFCEQFLAGSVTAADLIELTPGDAMGVDAEMIDSAGTIRQIQLHASPDAGASRTLLLTDTTELTSTQDHLVRRMAHDRFLHLLVSELLDGSSQDAPEVIEDILDRLSSYFGFVAVLLLLTSDDDPSSIVSFRSTESCQRETFERLSSELPLLEPPDLEAAIDTSGPGQVWHIDLDAEDRYALGLAHRAVTGVQLTVPDADDRELSLVGTLAGRQYPQKSDLELTHKVLSHISQFIRRSSAEQQIRRHAAIDEALATISRKLLETERSELLSALRLPAAEIGKVTRCSIVEVTPIALVGPELRSELDGWDEPRPVSPELLGYPASDRGTWAAPISDGIQKIGLLSYSTPDQQVATEARSAWIRLLQLVPITAARIDSKRRLEAAFENAPVGIALRDSDGRLVDCNDAFLRFVGAEDPDEILGRRQVDLIATVESDQKALDEWASGAAAGVELPFARIDGETVWGRISTTEVERGVTSMALDHIEDITDDRAARVELATQRTHDALTGLPTRNAIESELIARLDRREPVTVSVIDLDRFHTVNSSLGHVSGDRLLQLVAKRLQLTTGPRAVLARTGGDEFMVVAPIGSHQLGNDLAERILAAVSQPFNLDGHEILTSASIGVCLSSGSSSATDLLLGASDALAQAKTSGRNRVVHHTSKGDPRSVGLFESALRRAIRERALTVHYQPEVDLGSNLIVGAEALVRWPHPTEGLLGAGLFVPLAEEIGLSSELSQFVLEEACSAATQWRSDLHPNHFKIRVNLSPRDLEVPGIVDRVKRVLDCSGLPPDSLCLEVTETAFMRDQRTVVRHLHELAGLGISIAIDDFGTGFSSLWLLRELPFDTLKIDQAFVAALDSGQAADRAIVETIVSLGRTLGMEITAEGVETKSQIEVLRDVGVTRGQGYFFARPESSRQIVESIARANTERAERSD